jgi:predicted DNA-binding transcriptional regulator AlpA
MAKSVDNPIMAKDLEGYLRPKDAAKWLAMGNHTLYVLRANGQGPKYYKYGPKVVLYKLEDLKAWTLQRYTQHKSTYEHA